jgi:hypothetical protein
MNMNFYMLVYIEIKLIMSWILDNIRLVKKAHLSIGIILIMIMIVFLFIHAGDGDSTRWGVVSLGVVGILYILATGVMLFYTSKLTDVIYGGSNTGAPGYEEEQTSLKDQQTHKKPTGLDKLKQQSEQLASKVYTTASRVGDKTLTAVKSIGNEAVEIVNEVAENLQQQTDAKMIAVESQIDDKINDISNNATSQLNTLKDQADTTVESALANVDTEDKLGTMGAFE